MSNSARAKPNSVYLGRLLNSVSRGNRLKLDLAAETATIKSASSSAAAAMRLQLNRASKSGENAVRRAAVTAAAKQKLSMCSALIAEVAQMYGFQVTISLPNGSDLQGWDILTGCRTVEKDHGKSKEETAIEQKQYAKLDTINIKLAAAYDPEEEEEHEDNDIGEEYIETEEEEVDEGGPSGDDEAPYKDIPVTGEVSETDRAADLASNCKSIKHTARPRIALSGRLSVAALAAVTNTAVLLVGKRVVPRVWAPDATRTGDQDIGVRQEDAAELLPRGSNFQCDSASGNATAEEGGTNSGEGRGRMIWEDSDGLQAGGITSRGGDGGGSGSGRREEKATVAPAAPRGAAASTLAVATTGYVASAGRAQIVWTDPPATSLAGDISGERLLLTSSRRHSSSQAISTAGSGPTLTGRDTKSSSVEGLVIIPQEDNSHSTSPSRAEMMTEMQQESSSSPSRQKESERGGPSTHTLEALERRVRSRRRSSGAPEAATSGTGEGEGRAASPGRASKRRLVGVFGAALNDLHKNNTQRQG